MTPPKRHKFLEQGTTRHCEICGLDVQRTATGWAWTRRGQDGTAATLAGIPTHATLYTTPETTNAR